MKFKGSIDELKAAIGRTGITGTWSVKGNGEQQFKANDGGILNWWLSTGTISFQGPREVKGKLESAVQQAVESGAAPGAGTATAALPQERPVIFIVHGHDATARDQLELVLRRLDLVPFILMNTSGGGKTIIEALEGQIGKDHSSDFGIVLMTPDDMGYAKAQGPERVEPRARQNVILETGMLLSSLTRERMALIIKGRLEIPSDLQGIIHFGYNDHIREIAPKLCQRLREAGFNLDPNAISAASS